MFRWVCHTRFMPIKDAPHVKASSCKRAIPQIKAPSASLGHLRVPLPPPAVPQTKACREGFPAPVANLTF